MTPHHPSLGTLEARQPGGLAPTYSRRILIVEDELIVALDLESSLTQMGYDVVGKAATDDEALDLALAHHPDLVLMDVRLEGRSDGVEAAARIMRMYPVAVVFLTANSDSLTLERALQTEPCGYLSKPFDSATLRTTIEVSWRRFQAEQSIRKQSMTDALTGLHNRRYLDEALAREISFAQREGHELSVILLDLDRFKALNDSLGHAAGDKVLRTVAQCVQSNVRNYDSACRYGGDEIVVIVPGASYSATLGLAEKLRRGIEELMLDVDGRKIGPVTASFGVASFPEHASSLSLLFDAADAALYRAKLRGQNQVVGAANSGPQVISKSSAR